MALMSKLLHKMKEVITQFWSVKLTLTVIEGMSSQLSRQIEVRKLCDL